MLPEKHSGPSVALLRWLELLWTFHHQHYHIIDMNIETTTVSWV
jgi:hypothetical protein